MAHSIIGSRADKPDLDWSQVRETINMLMLSVAQIEATMTDGDRSVSELSESFTFIASKINDLIEAGQKLESGESSTAVNDIQNNASDIHQRVNGAIVAFQFYDRLTQRIHHVKSDLERLGGLISDSSQLYNPNAWRALQAEIASNYTMEEERLMFEHIMQGASVEQALEIYKHRFSEKERTQDDGTNDEIELF
ncbi:MAG: hypothetical protein H7A01_06415 [Hahellaceae bacterium]|nr:hypothetical protein [Hahellaceae bacterium]MCP5211852.1 hypothetical protein [Hahellaceae bacterium]